MEQEYVCSITPTDFEKYCLEILKGYAVVLSNMHKHTVLH